MFSRDQAELFKIFECFTKCGNHLSPEDICDHTKISKEKIKEALEILTKRGYLRKYKDDETYELTDKMLRML